MALGLLTRTIEGLALNKDMKQYAVAIITYTGSASAAAVVAAVAAGTSVAGQDSNVATHEHCG